MDVRSIGPDIEVSGVSLGAMTDGFKAFRSLAVKYLMQHGLMASKNDPVDVTKWFPLTAWINAARAIEQEVGSNVMFDVGDSVPRNAKFPDSIKDIESALRSIDVAYHMAHRKSGVVMFNPATGVMLEGIGHYVVTRAAGEKKISIVCDDPYPCRLDEGIITAMAKRFQRIASVVHETKKPCRYKGGDACTFTVIW
jgi:hypothetical protein